MKKVFKITGITIISLVLLLIIATIVLVNTVDLNRYKSQISNQVQQATGRTLTIDGDISWSLYPWLGVQVKNVELGNPAGFATSAPPLAKIAQLNVRVKLIPLLYGNVEVGTFKVNKPVIHLTTNKRGRTNFDFSQPSTTSSTKTTSAKSTVKMATSDSKKSSDSDMSINIDDINISDGHIIWDDQKTNQHINLANINLEISELEFDKTHIKLDDIELMVNDSKLEGDVNINNINTNPNAKFNLHINDLNLDHYLEAKPASKKRFSLNPISNTYAAPAQSQYAWMTVLQKLTAKGNISIDKLQVSNMHLTAIKVNLNAKNGVLRFDPMQAKLYNGIYKGVGTVDVRSNVLKITAEETLKDVEIQPLLKDATNSDIASGKLQFHVKATTRGFAEKEMLRNLQGNGNFAVNNGALIGVDANKQLSAVGNFIASPNFHNVPTGSNNGGKTNFSALSGSFAIANGTARNSDFLLDSSQFIINGNGYINLLSQAIRYKLFLKQGKQADRGVSKLFSKVGKLLGSQQIPIEVTGTVSNPSVSPDWMSIQQALLKNQSQQLLHETGKNLKKLFRF